MGQTWVPFAGAGLAPAVEALFTFSYDTADRRTSAANGEGGYAFTYDSLGRQRTSVDIYGSLTYTYDPGDRPLRVEYPDGAVVTSAYDTGGRLTSWSLSQAGAVKLRVDLGYTLRGQVETVSRLSVPEWSSELTVVSQTSYVYDVAGRTREVHQGAAALDGAHALTHFETVTTTYDQGLVSQDVSSSTVAEYNRSYVYTPQPDDVYQFLTGAVSGATFGCRRLCKSASGLAPSTRNATSSSVPPPGRCVQQAVAVHLRPRIASSRPA
jgi:YD repeat-containing protein